MVMLWSIALLALLSNVECGDKQLNRQKRFAAAYAGFPWSFAGAGFPGFGPFYPFPRPMVAPTYDYSRDAPSFDYPRAFVPFPFFTMPVFNKPWYEGENVCKEVRNANAKTPDEFGDWLSEDFPNFSSESSSEHETCKGSNTLFLCVKRSSDSSGQLLQATRYSCCHGFVRDPTGAPGCVETARLSQSGRRAQGIAQGNAQGSASGSSQAKTQGAWPPAMDSVDKVAVQ